MTAPMKPERLAELRALHDHMDGVDAIFDDLGELLVEVERLRAENTALTERAFVPTVTDGIGEAVRRERAAPGLSVSDRTAANDKPKVYVASKSRLGPTWRRVRTESADFIKITSTWIDESDESATGDCGGLWLRCITEASAADAMVALHEPGDEWKGAFVEIGAALASGVHVYVIGDPPGSWIDHPNIRCVDNWSHALGFILADSPVPPQETTQQ